MVYRSDTVTDDAARQGIPQTFRIAVSATRPPAVLYRMRQTLAIQPVGIGSAGAKAMALIDGDVDAYVHAGGQWEWDSAAPVGVVMAAGMHASRLAARSRIARRVLRGSLQSEPRRRTMQVQPTGACRG
jgi:3'(2'), 5'-bisphosphate nucleotidase